MTRMDRIPCWVVLAPLPPEQLEELVRDNWLLEVPYATDPPPWFVERVGGYSAVISPEQGTEGAERTLATRCSAIAPESPVYSLLLNPEREQIGTWLAGKVVSETDRDPRPLAASLGLELPRPAVRAAPPSVAVVAGASAAEVRQVLADLGDPEWIRATANRLGVLVSADDGPLGTQAWDIAEALPAAEVYYVQRDPDAGVFSVLVLRGGRELGSFLAPPLDDDTPRLTEILGATTPAAILEALDIRKDIL
jgi:hypothetical protein